MASLVVSNGFRFSGTFAVYTELACVAWLIAGQSRIFCPVAAQKMHTRPRNRRPGETGTVNRLS